MKLKWLIEIWLSDAENEVMVRTPSTVRVRDEVAEAPSESFTKACTANVPLTRGVHPKVLASTEEHPEGRPEYA